MELYMTMLTWFGFFGACVATVKTVYTPPTKRQGKEYVELTGQDLKYQQHDQISLLYSAILVSIYAYNYLATGIDLSRNGSKAELNIIMLGMSWYVFDLVLKYMDGVNNFFVWIHHALTILSMVVTYQKDETVAFGAAALFLNDAAMFFLVMKRTFERTNRPSTDKLFMLNFIGLTITFVLSRVLGNYFLMYTYAMRTTTNPLIVIGMSPMLSFGAIFSIKFLSKMWKYIPQWCTNPQRIEEMAAWKNIRRVFQTYNSRGVFKRIVDMVIYVLSVFVPIGIAVYFRFFSGVSEGSLISS